MPGDAREFWQELERRLPEIEDEPDRERMIAQSVLVLLRHRIPPAEVQHLKEELPDEIKELWSMRSIGLAEERSARPVVDLDHNWFLTGVKDLAGLSDMDEAARATAAVFGAVRGLISDTEARHVEQQLPAGLKELWRGDHDREGPHFEQGPSRFWELLSDRVEGRVPASDTDIACTVLAHLRGRLSPDLVRRINGAIPEDLREHWVAPEGGSEADEVPERFIGRVAEDLGLTDLDDASHAAAAALSAFKEMLPDRLAGEVEEELPDELRGLWESG